MSKNQNPEQVARDLIDAKLEAAGWTVGNFRKVNVSAHRGVAVREYPAAEGKAVEIIENVQAALEGFRAVLGGFEMQP